MRALHLCFGEVTELATAREQHPNYAGHSQPEVCLQQYTHHIMESILDADSLQRSHVKISKSKPKQVVSIWRNGSAGEAQAI